MNEERLNRLNEWIERRKENKRNRGDTVIAMEDFADEIENALATARRCNELEAERDALKEKLKEKVNVMSVTAYESGYQHGLDNNKELNIMLREAAIRVAFAKDTNSLGGNPSKWPSMIMYRALGGRVENGQRIDSEQDLKATPADSLREYRNEVLEEAAKKADKYYPTDDEIKEQGGCTQGQSMVRSVASAIRAMKEADNE